jgi:hypothetical protein
MEIWSDNALSQLFRAQGVRSGSVWWGYSGKMGEKAHFGVIVECWTHKHERNMQWYGGLRFVSYGGVGVRSLCRQCARPTKSGADHFPLVAIPVRFMA